MLHLIEFCQTAQNNISFACPRRDVELLTFFNKKVTQTKILQRSQKSCVKRVTYHNEEGYCKYFKTFI